MKLQCLCQWSKFKAHINLKDYCELDPGEFGAACGTSLLLCNQIGYVIACA
jgi:hypothetical protein